MRMTAGKELGECDNSNIVVAVNKHYNVAFVPPLFQTLEVAVPDLVPPYPGNNLALLSS